MRKHRKEDSKNPPAEMQAEPLDPAAEKHRIRLLSRTAREVRRYHMLRRILTALLSVLVTGVGILYIVAVLYKNTGSFTVSLDKFDMREYGLSLSESRTMTHAQSHLNAEIDEQTTNISYRDLPADVDSIDGAHNGENHIAYTFYLQNAGEEIMDYEYTVFVSGVTQELDRAIRIRLYHNGEPVTYARTRSDGGGAEPNTVEFFSEQIAAQKIISDFSPGEVDKFTVVIWIEGDDPDCTDDLIGGKLRVDMNMSVVQ